MTSFQGTHTLTIDSKGRMTIPSKYRDVLTKLFVVSSPEPEDACLFIYPAEVWEKVQAGIVNLPNTPAYKMLKRVFLGSAVEYVVDAQGRVLLTPELRKSAHLDKKIALVGQGNKFEVWDESAWQALCGGNIDEDELAAYKAALEDVVY